MDFLKVWDKNDKELMSVPLVKFSAADTLKYFSFLFFPRKQDLTFLCKLSPVLITLHVFWED